MKRIVIAITIAFSFMLFAEKQSYAHSLTVTGTDGFGLLVFITCHFMEPLIPDLRYEHAVGLNGSRDDFIRDSLVLSWPIHYWASVDEKFNDGKNHDWSVFVEPQWSIFKKSFRALAGTRHNFYIGDEYVEEPFMIITEIGALYSPHDGYGGFVGLGFGRLYRHTTALALVFRGDLTNEEFRFSVSVDYFTSEYFKEP